MANMLRVAASGRDHTSAWDSPDYDPLAVPTPATVRMKEGLLGKTNAIQTLPRRLHSCVPASTLQKYNARSQWPLPRLLSGVYEDPGTLGARTVQAHGHHLAAVPSR